MIIKFCFKNEIHRCSDVPTDFITLQSEYLPKLFTCVLPPNFKMSYTNKANEKIELNSQLDFQALIDSKPTDPIKVVITDPNEGNMIDDEFIVIQNNSGIMEERKFDPFSHIVQDIAESQVIQKYPYANGDSEEREKIKQLITQTIQEQMPSIIAQVKQALLQDMKFQNQMPIIPLEHNLEQANIEPKPKQDNLKIIKEKLQTFTQNIKHQLSEVPDKAKEILENVQKKLNNDPMMECTEGKYKRSVIGKAAQMHELFPEESMKTLLDFIKDLPSKMPIEQVIEVYLAKKSVVESNPANN